ncbi:MAG: hypothetical protein QOE70_4316 [Chthoniobacter sp.]|jgi:WD40 repeat protein|nr:hypothetical protein [Chthoniobacter sp.]
MRRHYFLGAVLALSISSPPCRSGSESPATDRPLPRLTVQAGHSGNIKSIAVSRDGQLAVTGSEDKTAILWDLARRAELRRFSGHQMSVESVAISADGRWVVTGSKDRTAIIWESATGRILHRLESPEGEVNAVAISPDGRLLATGLSTRGGAALRADPPTLAVLWSIETGKPIDHFRGDSYSVTSIAFSPDGKSVLMGTQENVAVLWNAANGKELCRFKGHAGIVTAVAFASSGKTVLTGSWDGTARLWDAASGKEVKRFRNPRGKVLAVAFSPDGKSVLTGTSFPENSAHLYDIAAGSETRSVEIHDQVFSAAFLAGGKTALLSAGSAIAFWDPASGEQKRDLYGLARSVSAARYSPDGRFIITENMGALTLWDIEKGGAPLRFENHQSGDLVFSRSGRRFLAGKGTVAELWDAPRKKLLRTFDFAPDGTANLTSGVWSVAISPDEKLAVTSNDATPHLWELETGRLVRRFPGHRGNVTRTQFSPDGKLLLTGSEDHTVRVWSVTSGRQLAEFPRFAGFNAFATFSPDSQHVLVQTDDDELTFWRADQKGDAWKIPNPNNINCDRSVSFSPDGRRLLVQGQLFDVEKRALVRMLEGYLSGAFSADGQRVAVAGEQGEVRVLDLTSGKTEALATGHTGLVWALGFSPDGRWIVTGSFDGTARVVESRSGRELCRLVVLNKGDWLVAAPDGRFDTGNLDTARGLSWVFPEEPFTAMPVEIFMRDYFEPGLLGHLAAGAPARPVRDFSSLDRAQPQVRIVEVAPVGGSAERLRVGIEIVNAPEHPAVRSGEHAPGVRDLRLFRNGALVATFPDGGGEIPLASGERKRLDFEVALPRRWPDEFEFAAYAFNRDRVKSATARQPWKRTEKAPSKPRRAWLVTVGVNVFECEEVRPLALPAEDARLMASAVGAALDRAGQFREIIPLLLLAEKAPAADAVAPPTKANLRAIFETLAGRPASTALPGPLASKLAKATPDDLLLVSFSTHGEIDAQGGLFLYPCDTGTELGAPLLEHSISSDELASWIQGVDAGEIVLLLDACYSGAAPGQEFRPGPLGDRNLGQLAYDKGLRLLAATQADNEALGSPQSFHGLLTTALIRDGLHPGRATRQQTLTLKEWLEYAAGRVPEIYAEEIRRRGDAKRQEPVLFDFARSKRDVDLVLEAPAEP